MKKHLINAGYFVAMIISALFMLRSCVNLAHAQTNPGYSLKGVLRTAIKADFLYAFAQFGWVTDSIAAHAQTRPRTPDNAKQRLVYMRGDTVFQRNSNGVEEPLLPPSVYQYHIDSLEAELYLYKPKPGVIIIELDTTSNRMVYREKIGHVTISNLYDDSLWVTDSIFVTAHRVNDGRVSQAIQSDSTFGALNPVSSLRVGETTEAWQWDTAKWEWKNSIITAPHIRGDSLFIDDSTFVLLQRLNKSK